MNLKTSAIALAVAGGIAAAPIAAQADSGFYASVRIGLVYKDTGGNDDIRVQGVASRFGFRGETDLGNGLTGFGRYEFGLATEGDSGTLGAGGSLNVSRRHAYVGLKGDFGKVTLGQTYHTYYNYISGPLDNPWIGSGFAMLAYTGRTAQGITYDNTWDAFSLGATLYMNDSAKDSAGSDETIDGYELAAAFDALVSGGRSVTNCLKMMNRWILVPSLLSVLSLQAGKSARLLSVLVTPCKTVQLPLLTQPVSYLISWGRPAFISIMKCWISMHQPLQTQL
jgi:predicted porin